MNTTLPGYDSWLSPPDPKGASGDSVIYVTRPIPIVLGCNGNCLTAGDVGVFLPGNPMAYPDPFCDMHGDGDGFALEHAGFDEFEVAVSFDSGSLYSATLADGSGITLTRDEIESAEVDYSDEMQAREESAHEDAYDRAREDR